jgi:hypothetical protein
MKIASLNKEIVISKNITRRISREYNELLLWNVEIDKSWEFKMNPNNMQKANDYLVKEMTWLSQEEVDSLYENEFDKIVTEINKTKSVPTQA